MEHGGHRELIGLKFEWRKVDGPLVKKSTKSTLTTSRYFAYQLGSSGQDETLISLVFYGKMGCAVWKK